MNSETNLSAITSFDRSVANLLPTLKILFVIDGRIQLNKEPDLFGLGFVLETLRHRQRSDFRIEVGVATREMSISDLARGTEEVLYLGFKFTSADFHIDDWHQIWFFADQPNQNDGGSSDGDENIGPPYELEDAEARLIAQWMDRGGGVFATGDHGVLGASLCHRIPRVRSMRKWTVAQGAPPNEGSGRNQTLQHDASNLTDEGDTLLQRLELVKTRSVQTLPFQFVSRPHPVLSSSKGPIDHFPDHMHEGELVPDDQVRLSDPLNISGYDRPEFPHVVTGPLDGRSGGSGRAVEQPRPHIIAYGTTTNSRYFELPPHGGNSMARFVSAGFKRFGVVGVYDGDSAGIGRVVCDSTWHHWHSLNLYGIAMAGNADYRRMQAYYRNIAHWLATPFQRQRLLLSAVWNALINSSPMAFSDRHTPWEMGERALALMATELTPSWINELVTAQVGAADLDELTPRDGELSAPEWAGLPEELVNRAVIGCICVELKSLAHDTQRELQRVNDVDVDPREIEARAARGLSKVSSLIVLTLSDAVASLGAIRNRLTKSSPGVDHQPT